MSDTKHDFVIENIYVNESSFDAPLPIWALKKAWEPNANLNLDVTSKVHKDNRREVSIILSVEVKIDEQVVFTVKVNQGGSFLIKGYNDKELEHLTQSFCATILYPYARQVVSDLVSRAGFPPLNLSPIDFETRFREMQKQKEVANQDK